MTGGGGDDVYIVDNIGDRVFEASDAGTDRVEASISFSLGKQFIENLTLTGNAAINGTGNTLDNVLLGNDAANKLKGGGGSDILVGGVGKDTLTGGWATTPSPSGPSRTALPAKLTTRSPILLWARTGSTSRRSRR